MNKQIKSSKGVKKFFNKYMIILLFIYFILGIGGTYAYLQFTKQNDSVIAGNVVAIDVDLEVDLVVGTNEEMVPLKGEALSNALNGVGSSNGACVDNVGNLSCQVYKITLINNGSRIKHIDGTIELYAKDGSGNVYNNLMWREIENPTTIKDGAIFHTMEKSKLVSDMTLESKETRIWYIAVFINEIDADQLETDKGDFAGTVTFDTFEVQKTDFIETVMKANAKSDSNIDFAVPSSTSGTNDIYLRSGTENDTYPIYYYRGNVNNNLIFADTCWKIVRTTETGGLKLIYNGVPSGGKCNNTGTASQIGTKAFNTSYNSPAYVGYKYSSPYLADYIDITSGTSYVYGNDVTYSNGVYTLTDTITSSDWSTLYQDGLKNNHYTCFSTGTTCESVYYIYETDSGRAYVLELTDGVNIEQALTKMLGADDSNIKNYNTTSSTIKGNNTSSETLDYWYYINIQNKGYNSYIEDTVWCNDRSVYRLGGFDPDGGLTNLKSGTNGMESFLVFSEYSSFFDYSMGTSMELIPSLDCNRNIDKFTVSELNGNGDLDYPVGLLSFNEAILAGGSPVDANNSYYLYTGSAYWTGSPLYISIYYAYEALVRSVGGLSSEYGVDVIRGIRPSISLKPGFTISGGTGTGDSPYVVQ